LKLPGNSLPGILLSAGKNVEIRSFTPSQIPGQAPGQYPGIPCGKQRGMRSLKDNPPLRAYHMIDSLLNHFCFMQETITVNI